MAKPEFELEMARAYRGIFLMEDGSLKPEGEAIMRDLEKITKWMVGKLPIDNTGKVDALQLAADQSRREVYAHIKKRLFAPLDGYKRQVENKIENPTQ